VSGRRIVLSGLGPKLEGLRWEANDLLRIGRQDTLDIVLHDPSVSRRHAEILPTDQGWVLCDLGSSNGTYLNGELLSKIQGLLRPDDLIQVGELSLRVLAVDSETAAAPPPPPPPTTSTEGRQAGSTEGRQAGPAEVVLLPEPPPPPQPQPAPTLAARTAESLSRLKASGTFVKVQARSQRTWEQAVTALAPGSEAPRQGQQLLALLRTGHHLSHIASLDELLRSILEDAVRTLAAQRASIVLADEATGQLQLRASVAAPGIRTNRSYSYTLAQRSFRAGESLLCADVSLDAALVAATSVQHGAMASIICAVLRSPRNRLGVLHLDRGPYQEPFTEEDFFLADAIAASVSVGIECAQLVEAQRDQFVQTVTALARAVEIRDTYTANHTQRVTDYALLLARDLGLSAAECQQIQVGTPLHDIGKIGIEDAILRKPGRLTDGEFEVMKSHTLKGAAILETIPALRPVLPIVRNHHERWDGRGYPDGLAQEEINRVARIVAVADAFDAMTSNRPYRQAMPLPKAFAELQRDAGTHFDPACVRAFLQLRADIERIMYQDAGPTRSGLPGVPGSREEQAHAENLLMLAERRPGVPRQSGRPLPPPGE
jgi:putative nucleotidyltransferase with HDIG domain